MQDAENAATTTRDTTEDVLATTTTPYGSTDNNTKHKAKKEKATNKQQAQVIEVPKGTGGGGDDASAVTEGQSVITSIIKEKPHVPSQNPCLWLFHLLQGIAALTSLMLLVSQLFPLFVHSSTATSQKTDILAAILKIYVSFICLAFMIVEAELPVPFVRTSTLLNTFWSRGFIYSFIGLVCTTEAYSERVDDLLTHSNQRFYIGWGAVFMQVSSWMMFAIGAIYMLLGMCCLRGLRDRMKQKEKEDWKQYRHDMRAWRQGQV